MFSGIVETSTTLLSLGHETGRLRMVIERPLSFSDINLGDSISVNGVCLTVVDQSSKHLAFDVGHETQKIVHWPYRLEPGSLLNVERSLQWGSRVHGHMVSGHVDGLAMVTFLQDMGDSWVLRISVDPQFRALIWPKGSIAINGVSLTINEVSITKGWFEVCLIPETWARTNLRHLGLGSWVHIEFDSFAKSVLAGVESYFQNKGKS